MLPTELTHSAPAQKSSPAGLKQKLIIHLRSTFHAGGTENLIVRFFNYPTDQFKVILVLMKPGPLMNDLHPSANQVRHLYRKGKISPGFIAKLLRLIKETRPDGIHTHQEIELFYAVIAKLFFPKLKLYHHIHLYNPKNNWEFYLERFLVKHFVQRLLLVSNALKEMVIHRGYPTGKMEVLPNIVQRTNRLSASEKEQFLRQIRYQPGEQIIGMIGNFVPEKDQLTLARAFKMIQGEFPGAKLVFIGKESPESAACRSVFQPEEIDKRVFFPGPKNNASELLPFFSLCVFASSQETFGMAALEALLYNTPLIASDIPVMRELSANGRYFELFESGNPQDLALRMSRRLNNPPDDAPLDESREYVENTFNPEKFIGRLAKIYSS